MINDAISEFICYMLHEMLNRERSVNTKNLYGKRYENRNTAI